MVFIEKVLLLCCLPILLAIVMPINCNKFNSQIDQSLKRFPRQVNANNDQQIGANDTHSSVVNDFGTSIQSGFDVRQGGKNVMHDKLSGSAILPGRNNERRGRQLNIYSQGGTSYNDYASQPWYLANKEYYDNYYANYYQSYYQTSTEPYRQQNYQTYPTQTTYRPNTDQQSPNQRANLPSSNQLVSDGTSSPNVGRDGDSVIYIDENGLFQISRSDALNAVSPVIDDDAIVFQSDESQYDRRTLSFNNNSGRRSRLSDDDDSQSKVNTFNGLPVFSN
ncbi:uncharacterized protein LOC119067691 [Bradysia coprophila]|uniref:uncharacterized protein LOC119067691 n=1 Tax=Bradysia coprophila TaxID=38358 RepID=UPI00187DC361|nr:uncharacterized protein LOC119067691 [Bradysia coprophila]